MFTLLEGLTLDDKTLILPEYVSETEETGALKPLQHKVLF